MIYDLLKADPLQGTFQIKDVNFSENKGFFGNVTSHRVLDWNTKRYIQTGLIWIFRFDFKVAMEYALFKKSKALFKETFDSYMAVKEKYL
jgi:hypothetical protein